ncbi:HNH endonuclease [Stygiobacter electus]|uniref:HNH endonuclease n=1 Tax=Stygiobacter electus TaxID=3032292 RepID=A0AAE3P2K1_9BACT|nr:HNH endonuclease [Stygiobacter electus]MDF1613234.1 HNH endonuclease [Stygiobacter electus]
MSIRKGPPYADEIDKKTGNLVYEGHYVSKKYATDPKAVDQPLTTPNGTWTENGKFYRAATDYKSGLCKEPELIKVYEKIRDGVWCYKGYFNLVDAKTKSDGKRKVFKFYLQPIEKQFLRKAKIIEFPHTRLIPTHVKVEVWKRDKGRCVQCGSTKNLHYDHDIPFSRGGSSITAENVRLLCAKHNLEKSDKIMSIIPYIAISASTISHAGKL